MPKPNVCSFSVSGQEDGLGDGWGGQVRCREFELCQSTSFLTLGCIQPENSGSPTKVEAFEAMVLLFYLFSERSLLDFFERKMID